MATTLTAPAPMPPTKAMPRVAPLENGDRLGAAEYLRRYEAMPDLRGAQLIEGVVYMPSPIRLAQHGEPHGLIQAWLVTYAARTPGTRASGNATVRLDADNVPEPDAFLRLLPECGGRTRVDTKELLSGPPELIAEVAASSAAVDLHDKLRAYRRAGVREYLVWRTLDFEFDWFVLEHDEYRPNLPDVQRLLRSPHFPGLVLALDALLAQDSAKVLDVLQAGLQTPEHAAFVAQLAKLKG